MTSKSLCVHRPLLNTTDIVNWAKEQGLKSVLHPEEMHVTQAYSKDPVEWNNIIPHTHSLTLPIADDRVIEPIGDKGAVALKFSSNALQARWRELLHGHEISHDFPEFVPHITMTYRDKQADWDDIKPYRGLIVLGPEVHKEINSDSYNPREIKLNEATSHDQAVGILAKSGWVFNSQQQIYNNIEFPNLSLTLSSSGWLTLNNKKTGQMYRRTDDATRLKDYLKQYKLPLATTESSLFLNISSFKLLESRMTR